MGDRGEGVRSSENSFRGSSNFSEGKTSDAGIDWKLSSRAQAVAKIPDAEFEQIVAARKPKAINHAVKNLARKATHSKIRAEAEKRNRPDAFAPFALIYADPPWEFETYSVKGKDGAAPDNHYPTMTVP